MKKIIIISLFLMSSIGLAIECNGDETFCYTRSTEGYTVEYEVRQICDFYLWQNHEIRVKISEDNNVIQYCRASTSCGYVMTGVFCPEDRYEWEVEINYLRYRCYNPYAVKLNDIFERWDRL